MIIFTKGHYAWVSVNSPAPREAFSPAKDPRKLTDAEKMLVQKSAAGQPVSESTAVLTRVE